jgi:hypothetical protein
MSDQTKPDHIGLSIAYVYSKRYFVRRVRLEECASSIVRESIDAILTIARARKSAP